MRALLELSGQHRESDAQISVPLAGMAKPRIHIWIFVERSAGRVSAEVQEGFVYVRWDLGEGCASECELLGSARCHGEVLEQNLLAGGVPLLGDGEAADVFARSPGPSIR